MLEEIESDQPMASVFDGVRPSTQLGLASDPRWRSVVAVLSSDSFAKSTRLSGFLSYVAERTLLGREDEVTEQQIGVHVFGRPSHYNPGEDNIVRQTARQLRQRLALYYQEEGRDAPIQVQIPRGRYIVEFQQSASSHIEEATTTRTFEPVVASGLGVIVQEDEFDDATVPGMPAVTAKIGLSPPLQRPEKRIFHARWLNLCLGTFFGAALMASGHAMWQYHEHPPSTSDKLWRTLFRKDQKTLVVVGDAGLNMYSNLARRNVGIEDYAQQNYLHTPEAATPPGITWAPFAARRYIALSDLAFVTELLRVPKADTKLMDIRFARDMHFSDLKNPNAILIGGPNYNPWVNAFDKRVDLQMIYEGERNALTVVNRAPAAGELATYTWSKTDPNRTGYALICLTDNIQATGRVLLIEGTTMGGIETATDFLFNPALMNPIIERATAGGGQLSNFDLLLETTFYPGGSLRARVAAMHTHVPAQSERPLASRESNQ